MTVAGMYFEKRGPVWETLRSLEQKLSRANIDYVFIDGLALHAHHYPRQTVDVDVVMKPMDIEKFNGLAGSIYLHRPSVPRRFVDSRTQVVIDVLVAGALAGDTTKNRTVRFPDPSESEVHGDLRTVSLARLIELELVTWRFKDWGNVVELIRRNSLEESFADRLDPSVRTAYGQCLNQANDPGYNGP